nr:hypothetical protein [Gemmatales bacterium]
PVTSTGRVIASLTMLIGLGLFGTFISLIGGAFITAMQDEEQQSLTVSKTAYILLRDWQRDNEEPYDIESLREHADKAIEEYVTRQKHLAFQNE